MTRTRYDIDYGSFTVSTFDREMAAQATDAGRTVTATTGDEIAL